MRCRLHLICLRPFGVYSKGDIVRDRSEVKRLLSKDRAGHFVQVRTMMREPAPAAAAAESTI